MDTRFVKRIHLILTAFAAAALISNITIVFYRREPLTELLGSNFSVPLLTILVLVLFFPFIKDENPKFARFMQYFHVTDLFLIAIAATLDEYDSIYGLGFFFSGGILALQYRLVSPKNRVAITLYFLAITAVVEFSAMQIEKKGVSLDVLAFLVFFYAILISTDKFRIRKFVNENKSLLGERDELKNKFDTAADMAHYVELPQLLSHRQMEIAQLIYSSRATDKENAYELGISVNTYRNHLKEIRRVLGVNTKVEVLTKVRPYFIALETEVTEQDNAGKDGGTTEE